ncbi:hypothetical protein BVI2075_110088 [Burkholderia vietnamiensis]|nr:hypothetical protein BVI2075_110088 [Burkholderia vietnamiensis]
MECGQSHAMAAIAKSLCIAARNEPLRFGIDYGVPSIFTRHIRYLSAFHYQASHIYIFSRFVE